jgi:hypothetical protein
MVDKPKTTIEVEDGTTVIFITTVDKGDNDVGLDISSKHVYSGDMTQSPAQRLLLATGLGVVDFFKQNPEPFVENGFMLASKMQLSASYGHDPKKQVDLENIIVKGTA